MIKKYDIQGGKIFQIDNFVESVQATELWFLANRVDYGYGHTSDTRSSQAQGRMVHQTDPELFRKLPIWKQIQSAFDSPLILKQAYINYANPSTVTLPHCDGTSQQEMTILICINQKWSRDFGGFTYFFESMNSQKVRETFVPEPRKAIFFKGSIWHCASPPTIFAPDPRFMLAIKTEFEN